MPVRTNKTAPKAVVPLPSGIKSKVHKATTSQGGLQPGMQAMLQGMSAAELWSKLSKKDDHQ